jgi:hypothetical protein
MKFVESGLFTGDVCVRLRCSSIDSGKLSLKRSFPTANSGSRGACERFPESSTISASGMSKKGTGKEEGYAWQRDSEDHGLILNRLRPG